MKLLQQLVASNVLSRPFNEPTGDQHVELLLMADPGDPYTTPHGPSLTVMYHPEGGFKFWLWDKEGWLCRVTTIEALVIFLLAEQTIGARNLLEGRSKSPMDQPLAKLVDVGDPARARAEMLRQKMFERRGEKIPTHNGPAKLMGIDQPQDQRLQTREVEFKELDNIWPTNDGED